MNDNRIKFNLKQQFLIDAFGQTITTSMHVEPYYIFKSNGYISISPDKNIDCDEYRLKELNAIEVNELTTITFKKKKPQLTKYYTFENLNLFFSVSENKLIGFYYELGGDIDSIFAMIENISGKEISKNISLICSGEKDIEIVQHEIRPLEIDFDTMYNDGFLNISEGVVDNLNEGSNGLYIFYGEPGSGKTNFIKWLITQVNREFIYVPSNLINLLSTPAFTKLLLKNPNSVLILEDCDEYVKERSNSTKDSVSTILNISDGILSDVLKMNIICTFNTKITNIDKALLRKGRLMCKYEFGELSDDKSKHLADKLGVAVPKIKTLCNFFNTDESDFSKNKKNTIGFNV